MTHEDPDPGSESFKTKEQQAKFWSVEDPGFACCFIFNLGVQI